MPLTDVTVRVAEKAVVKVVHRDGKQAARVHQGRAGTVGDSTLTGMSSSSLKAWSHPVSMIWGSIIISSLPHDAVNEQTSTAASSKIGGRASCV